MALGSPGNKRREHLSPPRPFRRVDSALRAGLHRTDAIQRHGGNRRRPQQYRSEEHTSELQSHLNLVCRLLLEKKKKKKRKKETKKKEKKKKKNKEKTKKK